jgi:hypothetical protein
MAVCSSQLIVEMHPEASDVAAYSHDLRGEMYVQQGKYDDGVGEFLKGLTTKLLTGDSPDTIEALKRAYEASGFKGYWQKQLDLASERYRSELQRAKQQSESRYVSPILQAQLHARLGDKEAAFALLEECYRNRDEGLTWLKAESLRANSPWENLRTDPRFTALLRRLGLEPRK